MAVALPHAHSNVTLVQQIEFAHPFGTYVAYPYGLGGDSKGGGFAKSPLGVFSLWKLQKNISLFLARKEKRLFATPFGATE